VAVGHDRLIAFWKLLTFITPLTCMDFKVRTCTFDTGLGALFQNHFMIDESACTLLHLAFAWRRRKWGFILSIHTYEYPILHYRILAWRNEKRCIE
jgi:hypothetical protein